MEVIIRETCEDAVELVSALIAKAIREKPYIVLGLATGRTMESVYARLVDLHENESLDFSQVSTFNLDEYIGLSPDDEHSYHYYMNQHLFSKVNINNSNTHLPDGAASNTELECHKYEEKIAEHGGIDLQLLGIGTSGHIGFNEPLSAMLSRTREKVLTPQTIKDNSTLFNDPDLMPRRAITMGVGTILESGRCLLLAIGEDKADILSKAVEGPVTSMISASALQLHPRCTVIIDEAAASKLTQTDYYRWIFDNEPEWQEFR